MIVIDSQSRQQSMTDRRTCRESDRSGRDEQGEQLPSVRALAVELSINPNTIRKHMRFWKNMEQFIR